MNRTLARISLASLVTAALGLGSASAAATPTPPSPVRVRLVASEAAGSARWVAGSVQAARKATLATRLAASVRAVNVEEGQAVAAGQLLVSLADSDLRGQLAAAEAGLATSSAHERRIKTLAAQRAATPSELEAATAQRAQAEAAVAAVRANLAYTEIRAPFAATVQARRVDPGDLVGPGQPLVLLEGSGLEIVASLSEEEAQGMAIGRKLRFVADGREGTAEVVALAPGGDPTSHRRSLRARVAGDAHGWRSGSFARIALPAAAAATRDARVWVPRSALVERGDLNGVFVAVDGRAELRWVALGEGVGDRAPIRAGIAQGEAIIDAPGALRDGDAVEIAR